MLTEIVNHLWQSTLVAAALAALAAMLRDDGAHARYWLWWAASVKFLVPFSLLSMLGSSARRRRRAAARARRLAGRDRRARAADARGGLTGRRSRSRCSGYGRSGSQPSPARGPARAEIPRAAARVAAVHRGAAARRELRLEVRTSQGAARAGTRRHRAARAAAAARHREHLSERSSTPCSSTSSRTGAAATT